MLAGGSGCHRRRSRQMQTKIIIIMASVEKSIATAADMTIRCNFGTFSIAMAASTSSLGNVVVCKTALNYMFLKMQNTNY